MTTATRTTPIYQHTQGCFETEQIVDQAIGRTLVRLRTDRGLSRADLAILSGLPEWCIEDHETGSIPIPVSRLPAIARGLGLPVRRLAAKLLKACC